jgi:hypothetical protein
MVSVDLTKEEEEEDQKHKKKRTRKKLRTTTNLEVTSTVGNLSMPNQRPHGL